MRLSPRLLTLGLTLLASGSPLARAAQSAPVPVQRPQNAVQPQPAGTPPTPDLAPTPGTAPTTGANTPAAPPLTAPADPSAAPTPQPTAPAPTQPTEPAPTGAPPPGLAEQLLGPSVNQAPERRPSTPTRSEEEAIAAEDEAVAALYRDMFRPKSNPGRFHILARAQYTLGSSIDGTLSGRTGGLQLDLGQSWNFIGYAASLRAEGGAIDFGPEGRNQLTGLLGGGPTLTIGRLGMMQRGYLDVRLGYDFLYAPARQRLLEGGVQALPGYAPHGPRVQLNLGLLINPGSTRRLFHGVGLGLGYQVLVASFRGDLPTSQFLQFSLNYWGS